METSTKGSQKISYTSYLKVSELLSLQHSLSDPKAHDELLFITIHQVYELWFKQIIHELEAVIGLLRQNQLFPAFHLLDRVGEIFRVLVQQVDILETMTPVEFNQFRAHLNPASGFQSWQFRELEMLMGADPENYSKFGSEPEWKAKLQAREKQPSLRTVFIEVLAGRGLIKSKAEAEVCRAIEGIYEKPLHDELQSLCEYLIQLDEQVLLWRFRHVQMVERMIGMKMGTGGSLGVNYLQATLKKKFFPELWNARTAMGSKIEYGVPSTTVKDQPA